MMTTKPLLPLRRNNSSNFNDNRAKQAKQPNIVPQCVNKENFKPYYKDSSYQNNSYMYNHSRNIANRTRSTSRTRDISYEKIVSNPYNLNKNVSNKGGSVSRRANETSVEINLRNKKCYTQEDSNNDLNSGHAYYGLASKLISNPKYKNTTGLVKKPTKVQVPIMTRNKPAVNIINDTNKPLAKKTNVNVNVNAPQAQQPRSNYTNNNNSVRVSASIANTNNNTKADKDCTLTDEEAKLYGSRFPNRYTKIKPIGKGGQGIAF